MRNFKAAILVVVTGLLTSVSANAEMKTYTITRDNFLRLLLNTESADLIILPGNGGIVRLLGCVNYVDTGPGSYFKAKIDSKFSATFQEPDAKRIYQTFPNDRACSIVYHRLVSLTPAESAILKIDQENGTIIVRLSSDIDNGFGQ